MATEITYPTKDVFLAMNALQPTFDIETVEGLYVDFDNVRKKSSIDNLMFRLGVQGNKLNDNVGNAKILFSGHTGTGKSTELQKLQQRLKHPDLYFPVYLNIQEYVSVTEFKPDDLLVFMVAALANALQEAKIDYSVTELKRIADDWLSDEEIVKELKSRQESEGKVVAEVGTPSWLSWFTAKANIKSLFSHASHTSRSIRQKVQEKQGEYISQFNVALAEIRQQLNRANMGKSIIFLVDGIEQLRSAQYTTFHNIFVHNTTLVAELNSSMVWCIPIDSVYDQKMNAVVRRYQLFMLPLLPINNETAPLFAAIVTRRIDQDTFFEEGALEHLVQQSGGSPRQLMLLVYEAIVFSRSENFRISREIAEEACHAIGLDLRRTLTAAHIDCLQRKDYDNANEVTLGLVYSLCLMEYNGKKNNREPNPLLRPFIDGL